MTNKLIEIVERQVAEWQLKQRLNSATVEKGLPAPNVITLSNERGAGGLEVARRLSELLQIPVYDREIVEHIATHDHVRASTVETLDEHALGRVDNYLMNLFRDKSFDQTDYARALAHTLLALWHHGPAILIGRGAVHVIGHEHALAVRVVATMPDRLARLRKLDGVSTAEAARTIADADAEREAFSRLYYDNDIGDPKTYDMVLNTSLLTIPGAASLAADAYRLKFGRNRKDAGTTADAHVSTAA